MKLSLLAISAFATAAATAVAKDPEAGNLRASIEPIDSGDFLAASGDEGALPPDWLCYDECNGKATDKCKKKSNNIEKELKSCYKKCPNNDGRSKRAMHKLEKCTKKCAAQAQETIDRKTNGVILDKKQRNKMCTDTEIFANVCAEGCSMNLDQLEYEAVDATVA